MVPSLLLPIFGLLANSAANELTINEISARLGKPYATVNNRVHDAIREGIIMARPIGKARLCRLVWNEATIAALTYRSLLERTRFLEEQSERKRSEYDALQARAPTGAILILKEGKTYASNELKGTIRLTPETIKAWAGLSSIFLAGHEAFWRMAR